MKLLCVGDLHGRKPKIHFKDFDAIIFVGDVCSDEEIGPIKDMWVRYLEENPDFPVGMDIFIAFEKGEKGIKKLEKKSLQEGRKIMEYLNSFGKPVYMVPGNWDQSYGETRIKDMEFSDYNYYKAFLDFWLGEKINSRLTRGLKNIINCQYKLHKTKEFNILGYGLSSNAEDLSLKKKRVNADYNKKEYFKLKKTYKKILDKLVNTYNKKDDSIPTIFLTHNVPHNTKLDLFLDEDSNRHKSHFGSTVARWFCDKYQPLLCIGGHMHEHFGKCKIGKTTVINVGFGSHVNTLINIKDGKIKKIDFWDGKKEYKIKN